MIKQMRFIVLFTWFGFSFVWAAPSLENLDDRRLSDAQHQQQFDDFVAPTVDVPSIQSDSSSQSVALTEEELQHYPDLIIRALLAALLQNNGDNVATLLPHYQRLPENLRESLIETWGKAVQARWQGDDGLAVRLYREVLAQKADWNVVRLQAASALLGNKEWEAAEEQFRKLQSEEAIPPELLREIEQVLTYIRQQSRWQFQGGATLINDKNINNVPKNPDLGGGFRTDEMESGQGLSLQLGTSKKWFWHRGWFNEVRLDSSYKYYWNNQRFNEANIRAAVGLGYQDAKNSLTVLPFFENMWYAGGKRGDSRLHRFSYGRGLAVEASRQLTPKWQGNLYLEGVKNTYQTRPHLNGFNYFASVTLAYRHHAQQSWFGGVDYLRSQTQDDEDSFVRQGVRAGWLQEWRGLSTRLSVSYAWKQYRDVGFFNKIQKNREWGMQTSVWHRAIHWQGLTPRLTWSYSKTSSNIPLYQYDKHRVFIEVSKQF